MKSKEKSNAHVYIHTFCQKTCIGTNCKHTCLLTVIHLSLYIHKCIDACTESCAYDDVHINVCTNLELCRDEHQCRKDNTGNEGSCSMYN